jgi:hypothetical protein
MTKDDDNRPDSSDAVQPDLAELLKSLALGSQLAPSQPTTHKFWSTQPVPQQHHQHQHQQQQQQQLQLQEEPVESSNKSPIISYGPIEPNKPLDQVRQDPYKLPHDFEWCLIDISQPDQLKELYELLSANYVEDSDAIFRFDYSAEFLKWYSNIILETQPYIYTY